MNSMKLALKQVLINLEDVYWLVKCANCRDEFSDVGFNGDFQIERSWQIKPGRRE